MHIKNMKPLYKGGVMSPEIPNVPVGRHVMPFGKFEKPQMRKPKMHKRF